MAGGHNKVEYFSGSHLKESGFQSKDLSLALALSLGCGLRYNMPTPALCRSGYTPQEATIKLNIARSHLKQSSFRSIDLSIALSLRRGLRRIVARVLGAPRPKSSTVASCS